MKKLLFTVLCFAISFFGDKLMAQIEGDIISWPSTPYLYYVPKGTDMKIHSSERWGKGENSLLGMSVFTYYIEAGDDDDAFDPKKDAKRLFANYDVKMNWKTASEYSQGAYEGYYMEGKYNGKDAIIGVARCGMGIVLAGIIMTYEDEYGKEVAETLVQQLGM